MDNANSEPTCFSCHKPLDHDSGNIGRSESCPHCGNDVRACYNCKHYDIHSYNECREPQAERVLEKNRANFCDYFWLSGAAVGEKEDSKQKTLNQLDDLFKK